jgi:hypothetical protein
MTKTITKKMDVAGKKPAETRTTRDSETNDSSLPIWKDQHGRVQGAMWKYVQDDGKTRHTISISRSYMDKDEKEWKNVHYFDRKDLADVRSIALAAEEELLKSEGMEVVDDD